MDSSQLSFVVQGPFDPIISRQVIDNIRCHFPLSEIILSTWEDAETNDLNCDQVILNQDPGSVPRTADNKVFMNANRLYVSSRNGIAQATREWVIKIRSDMGVANTSLLECLQSLSRFSSRDGRYCFTQDRIIVTNVSSVNPHRYLSMPYHLCDWFYAGRREDIIHLFDLPEYPEREFARWFETHPKPACVMFPSLARYSSEAYLTYHFVKKHLPVSFENSYDTSNNNIQISERVIANNFVIYNNDQLGLFSYKYRVLDRSSRYWMYTYYDWVRLYNRYCLAQERLIYLNMLENIKNYFFFNLYRSKLLKIFYQKIKTLRKL